MIFIITLTWLLSYDTVRWNKKAESSNAILKISTVEPLISGHPLKLTPIYYAASNQSPDESFSIFTSIKWPAPFKQPLSIFPAIFPAIFPRVAV